ncbi:hypothetical protein DACRYDRAFT_112332 [Dacryopinax primogenitus]|uniref:rRNA-processing protein EFG1 n=1 Tax=Dacryopinax primogenitus (strain DJM 731) TaxID=1858805 RepID=M5FPD9_DACPD|nr:uncharacterized protein DACRYDRAFT_112332 [Dacryopinax primogenitus]EJT97003.1 hypothetical protein DACRYDRAFT_112332 [Dacryopinax primogenitus]
MARDKPSKSLTGGDTKPGISKLKSSLRQVKRLLLKPNLDAALKRDTQRRAHALDQELQTALKGQREREMVQRYRMVRFFERRKVERALGRAERELGELDGRGMGEAGKEGKERRRLEKEVRERRVDLGYIIHYPKSKKYVSLLKETTAEASKEREEVRAWVRREMDGGRMGVPRLGEGDAVSEGRGGSGVKEVEGKSKGKTEGDDKPDQKQKKEKEKEKKKKKDTPSLNVSSTPSRTQLELDEQPDPLEQEQLRAEQETALEEEHEYEDVMDLREEDDEDEEGWEGLGEGEGDEDDEDEEEEDGDEDEEEEDGDEEMEEDDE